MMIKAIKKISLILLVSFVFIELSVRIGLYLRYHELRFLLAPYFDKRAPSDIFTNPPVPNAAAPKSPSLNGGVSDGTAPRGELEIQETSINSIRDGDGCLLYYKLFPGSHKHTYCGGKYNVTYYVNKYGFRNPDIEPDKRGVYRIIMFGGSTVAGLESPDDETLPFYLEQFLRKKRPDVEVINMGFPVYTIDKVYHLFTMEAYKFKPDMVVIYNGRNDIHHSFESLVLDTPFKKKLYQIHVLFYYKVMSYSYFIEKISIMLQGHPDPWFFAQYDPLPIFMENFKKILDFADKNGIKVVYVNEVENYDGNPRKMKELVDRYVVRGERFPKKYPGNCTEAYIISLLKLQAMAKETGAAYRSFQAVDPKEAFYKIWIDNPGEYFLDNNRDLTHLSSKGNKVLAGLVADRMSLE